MKRRHFIQACALSLAAVSRVQAQDRVIRIVVPFAPGGSADLIPRLIAGALAERLGQSVIVENRPGAGGAVGALHVSRAAPDGLTLGVATVSTHAIQPAVSARPGYQPLRDFPPSPIWPTSPTSCRSIRDCLPPIWWSSSRWPGARTAS